MTAEQTAKTIVSDWYINGGDGIAASRAVRRQLEGKIAEAIQAAERDLAAAQAALVEMTADRDSETRWAKQYHDNWVGVCNEKAALEGSLRLTTAHLKQLEADLAAAQAVVDAAKAWHDAKMNWVVSQENEDEDERESRLAHLVPAELMLKDALAALTPQAHGTE